MRYLFPLLGALALTACAPTPDIHTATMPLEILRAEGQAPRMGEVKLSAGSYGADAPFSLDVWFNHDEDGLGPPRQVGWTVKFGDYCRDRPSWVQSVLIGPSGTVWPGFRVHVPAGPDRTQNWSSGSTGARGPGAQATPGLLEAMAAGGVYRLALQDDEGRLWNEVTIDTLTPVQWRRLFAVNQAAVAKADPAMPPRSETMLVLRPTPRADIPTPPRRCP